MMFALQFFWVIDLNKLDVLMAMRVDGAPNGHSTTKPAAFHPTAFACSITRNRCTQRWGPGQFRRRDSVHLHSLSHREWYDIMIRLSRWNNTHTSTWRKERFFHLI
uniref:Secreted protein n=1 Tax=Bionectria ochroleuca TaxID=29856 RepID=A0A8H7K8J2_BIOOC